MITQQELDNFFDYCEPLAPQRTRQATSLSDRDYNMGIPFDVDAYMERAWARMDECYDDGGEDE